MCASMFLEIPTAFAQVDNDETGDDAPTNSTTDKPLPEETQSTENSPPSHDSTPDRLSVFLVLVDTTLTRQAVFDALQEEFQIPIVDATEGHGLVIRVEDTDLTVSFIDQDGQTVVRTIVLPKDEARQLDAIALLSGNLARDEAGALLAQLKANEPPPTEPEPEEEEELEEDIPPPPLPPPVDEVDEATATEEAPSPVPGPAPPKEGLEDAWFSASLTGDISIPTDLSERRTHMELGLVYSRFGGLDGAAVTFLASYNRGLSPDAISRGGQVALAWTQRDGPFEGAMVSLASASFGPLWGAQVAGLVGLQFGELEGAQLAGLFGITRGNSRAAQLAGLSHTTIGNLAGAQLAGLSSVTTGDLVGAQMAPLLAATGGRLRGAQLSALAAYSTDISGAQLAVFPVARTAKALQLGVINTAYKRLEGLQIGLVNIAGSWSGTQVGMINLAGKGKGTQVGMLNVAFRNEGTSIGMIDVVPGMRTQLLSYASYTPSKGFEGIPRGPLGYVGVKFLPQPIYTHLSFGAGPEGEECFVEPETDEEECVGGQATYAVAWGIGLHAKIYGPLFAEFDLTYQFERGFNSSRSSRHGVLLRSSLGVQLAPAVALFAGAGPRLDFHEGPRLESSPETGFSPIYYGGLQFF